MVSWRSLVGSATGADGVLGGADMQAQFVFESYISKRQQLLLATQVVRAILKIDDVVRVLVLPLSWAAILTIRLLQITSGGADEEY